jgi:transposase
MNMLRHRKGERLDEWLRSVRDSHIKELQSFVRSIEPDKAAVLAGLTLPQSNGIVEGKVNKLKLIKRMGFGRAGFPLLRQRVLHALESLEADDSQRERTFSAKTAQKN